jgi:hypothetical protein
MLKKFLALLVHAVVSALLLAGLLMVITQIWFPSVTFELENVWQALIILIPVHFIIGPVLTGLIYKPKKPGLIGDLLIILAVQAVAFGYGAHAIYQARPAGYIFVGDRFEVIPNQAIELAAINPQQLTISNQPFLAYALPAQSELELKEFIENDTQYQLQPERYYALLSYREQITSKALDPWELALQSANAQKGIQSLTEKHPDQDLLLFILQGTTKEAAVLVLDKELLTIVDYLAIDPWLTQQ